MAMKVFFYFLASLFLSFQIFAQSLWYHYSSEYQTIGLSQISYNIRPQDKAIYKQQSKIQLPVNVITEQVSAVLDLEYTLRSAHITGEISYKKNQADSQYSSSSSAMQFCIITVADRILIQKPDGIKTLPFAKFYLDTTDFLRSLSILQKPSFGNMFQANVLSIERNALIKAKARYLGQKIWIGNLQEFPCHLWEVTTTELKNFWAKAYISLNGDLLAYELGGFRVANIPEIYAQDARQNLASINAPTIFDADEIDWMQCNFSSEVNTSKLDSENIQNSSAESAKIKQQNEIFLQRPYQQISGSQLTLNAIRLANPNISWQEITTGNIQHIQPTKMLPSRHPLILKYATEIRYGNQTPVGTARNIAQWCYHNLEKKRTPVGHSLALFLGLPQNISAIAMVVLSRNCGIPARIVSGLQYEPGKWKYSAWAEVYLGQWIPVYQGKIGTGAIFLTMYEDSIWVEKNAPKVAIQIQKIQKFGQIIDFSFPHTYFIVAREQILDLLLGLRFQCPNSWKLSSKDLSSDIYYLYSLQEEGPSIVLRVIELHPSLEEFVQDLAEKMGLLANSKTTNKNTKIELLWQQPRKFPNVKDNQGKALEVALQTTNKETIYRVFLGQVGTKAVLAVLVVPQNDFAKLEPGFQQFINSLRFVEKK